MDIYSQKELDDDRASKEAIALENLRSGRAVINDPIPFEMFVQLRQMTPEDMETWRKDGVLPKSVIVNGTSTIVPVY